MAKIVLVGAGGVIFSQNFMKDFLMSEHLTDSTLTLMDIDRERLANAEKIFHMLAAELNCPTRRMEATTDLEKALNGADFVLTIFRSGTLEHQRIEYEIPAAYGVKLVVGDSMGPGGIFRGLRTLKDLFNVLNTMERVCPGAVLLNYVNPMSMNTIALSRCARTVKVYGLCHSVQSLRSTLAQYLNVPADELEYFAAGVNHLAFALKLSHRGRDLYPELRKLIDDPGIYHQQKVQFEILRHFGYYPTEGSGHNSEYLPFFRKREDLLKKFCSVTWELPDDDIKWSAVQSGEPGASVECCRLLQIRNEKNIAMYLNGTKKFDLKRSHEYGMQIIEAILANKLFQANLNVMNHGLIPNLPAHAAVEVPCLIDGSGIHPCQIPDFPEHLAALDRNMTGAQILAAQGAVSGKREDIFHALAADPLTAAVLSLDEIKEMCGKMFDSLADQIDDRFQKND
jgi:alpha-galactosidase